MRRVVSVAWIAGWYSSPAVGAVPLRTAAVRANRAAHRVGEELGYHPATAWTALAVLQVTNYSTIASPLTIIVPLRQAMLRS